MFSLSARPISHAPAASAAHGQHGQHGQQARSPPEPRHVFALVQLGSSQLVVLRPCSNSGGQCLSMALIQDEASQDSSVRSILAQRDRQTAPGQVIRAVAGHTLSTSTGQAFTLDHDGHVDQYAFGIDSSPFLTFKRQVAAFPMAGLAPTDLETTLVCLAFPRASGFSIAIGRTVYVWLQHHTSSPGAKNPHQQRLCLEDHSSPVVAVSAIVPFIVTLSADHSFKLWDIGGHSSPAQLKCIYHSEILSAVSPPTFMTTDQSSKSLYIGSADGVVRVIQVKPIPTPPFAHVHTLHTLPVAKWILESLQNVQNEADRAASTMCISAKGGNARQALAREDSGLGADAVAGLSHAVLACHVAESRVYTVTASHLVVCSLARQQPVFIHDFRDPLKSDSAGAVIGLLRSALVPVHLVDDGESSITFVLIPLIRKASTHFLILDLLESAPSADGKSDRISPDSLATLDNLSLDEPVSHSTPLSHVLLRAIALHHGRGRGQPGFRPGKWLQAMAESTLAQLQSVHILTVGDLLHSRESGSSRNTQLSLPLGLSKILDSLCQLVSSPSSSTTADAIQIRVQELDSTDLLSTSPLHKHTWISKPKAAPSKLDKPITYRSTVKSSGYSSAPAIPRHFLASRKSSKSTSSALPPSKANDPAATNEWDLIHENDSRWASPCTAVVSHSSWHPGPIASISISPQEGRYVTVGGADGSAHILRSSGLAAPISDSSPSILSSSRVSGSVKSSSWSHDCRTVMLCSSNVVRVWEPRAIGNDPTAPGTEDPYVDIPDLAPGSVASAQFVHKSRLALVAHKNRVELFKYQLHPTSPEVSKQHAKHLRNTFTSADLKPRLPSGRAKSVWHLSTSNNAQQVTSLSAWNNRAIPLAVFAASDKSLCVADLNQGVLAARVSTDSSSTSSLPSISSTAASVVAGSVPTSRFIHSIYTSTSNPSDPASSHHTPHLFLTTAHGDTVRLWDMRTMTTVVRFGTHLPCARHLREPGSTGAIMAPCGTLVAVPTDMPGQAVALFDIRKAGTKMADQVGAIPVMQSQVKKPGRLSVSVRAASRLSRPGSVLGSASAVGTNARSEAGVGVPRCATMGGELVGGMAFHGERAVLVVGTTRGGLLSYRMA